MNDENKLKQIKQTYSQLTQPLSQIEILITTKNQIQDPNTLISYQQQIAQNKQQLIEKIKILEKYVELL